MDIFLLRALSMPSTCATSVCPSSRTITLGESAV